MTSAPRIVERAEQPYLAVRQRVTMAEIPLVADRIREVFDWVAAHGLTVAGAPFFRYHVIDMARELDMAGGVPVAALPADELAGDGLVTGVLPAGRYATVTHVGHPRELVDVTGDLLDWARAQGLKWDMSETDSGERWGCRLELYRTDPAVEPDMDRWEVELLFRLAD